MTKHVLKEVHLTTKNAAFFDTLAEELVVDNDDDCASKVINYSLEILSAFEDTVRNTIGIDDPMDFIEGIKKGYILIVNHLPKRTNG